MQTMKSSAAAELKVKAKATYQKAKAMGLPVTYTQLLKNEGEIPPLVAYKLPRCTVCDSMVAGDAWCGECKQPRGIQPVDMIWDFQGDAIQSRGTEVCMFLKCACGCSHISGFTFDSRCYACDPAVLERV